jgi:hypothetical protein
MSASTTPALIQQPEYPSSQRTLDNESIDQGDHLLSQLGINEDNGERPPLLYVRPVEVESPIQQHHSAKSKKKSILREWWSEIAMSAFSISLFFAIATLLWAYNALPPPSWGFHLNVNSMIAILSTLLRSSLFMILEQGLFQYHRTSFNFSSRSADESNYSSKSTEVELAHLSPSSSASAILRSS